MAIFSKILAKSVKIDRNDYFPVTIYYWALLNVYFLAIIAFYGNWLTRGNFCYFLILSVHNLFGVICLPEHASMKPWDADVDAACTELAYTQKSNPGSHRDRFGVEHVAKVVLGERGQWGVKTMKSRMTGQKEETRAEKTAKPKPKRISVPRWPEQACWRGRKHVWQAENVTLLHAWILIAFSVSRLTIFNPCYPGSELVSTTLAMILLTPIQEIPTTPEDLNSPPEDLIDMREDYVSMSLEIPTTPEDLIDMREDYVSMSLVGNNDIWFVTHILSPSSELCRVLVAAASLGVSIWAVRYLLDITWTEFRIIFRSVRPNIPSDTVLQGSADHLTRALVPPELQHGISGASIEVYSQSNETACGWCGRWRPVVLPRASAESIPPSSLRQFG
ncbi:hypothetical protein C8R45DRAFT_1184938 [Mycena sanguinolenta]|nr:hypothetical protein C8R45DRAFT_1184938 [Mycena sanguinolenta]